MNYVAISTLLHIARYVIVIICTINLMRKNALKYSRRRYNVHLVDTPSYNGVLSVKKNGIRL